MTEMAHEHTPAHGNTDPLHLTQYEEGGEFTNDGVTADQHVVPKGASFIRIVTDAEVRLTWNHAKDDDANTVDDPPEPTAISFPVSSDREIQVKPGHAKKLRVLGAATYQLFYGYA